MLLYIALGVMVLTVAAAFCIFVIYYIMLGLTAIGLINKDIKEEIRKGLKNRH